MDAENIIKNTEIKSMAELVPQTLTQLKALKKFTNGKFGQRYLDTIADYLKEQTVVVRGKFQAGVHNFNFPISTKQNAELNNEPRNRHSFW